ncbi:MAG: zf-TFIIB domain-containing protein [Planctomycetota bacterium]
MADLIKQCDPTPDDPTVVNPLNGIEMERLDIGGIKIDRCPSTGAIWLDRGELSRLSALGAAHRKALKALDVSRDDVTRRGVRGAIKSPRTGVPMMVVNDPQQSHIEFEVCPECGGCFFDAGELYDLLDYSFTERLKSFFS